MIPKFFELIVEKLDYFPRSEFFAFDRFHNFHVGKWQIYNLRLGFLASICYRIYVILDNFRFGIHDLECRNMV